jgi:hypothetical protein
MKLLCCNFCGDIVKILHGLKRLKKEDNPIRHCHCGISGAQYVEDETVGVSGAGRVFEVDDLVLASRPGDVVKLVVLGDKHPDVVRRVP